MRRSKRRLLSVTLLLAVASGSPLESAVAGDATAVRAKVRTLCQNCHGEDGVALLPGAANLSGQQREYLREQLRAYRSGRRQDAQMNIVAKTLTDADIESFADWYSAIKVTVEMPK